MNPSFRKIFVGGNWKMNLLPSDVKDFAEKFIPALPTDERLDITLCVPFVMLPAAVHVFQCSPVKISAQNISEHESGAYTGEVSCAQVADLGVHSVVIGHSERRAYYGETDSVVNKKLSSALAHGLRPIVCVGESDSIRTAGTQNEFVADQIKKAFAGIERSFLSNIVVAYEPVWAIGTGKAANPHQAQEMCSIIRTVLSDLYGADAAQRISIAYGGSANAENIKQFLKMPDIDGGLIGGASLTPESFASIISESFNTLKEED